MQMDWRQITAVTLDLDGTLLRYERSPDDVLQQAYENIGSEPLFDVGAYYARYDEFASRYDSLDRARAECFATLAAERGYDAERGRAVADAFSAERDQSRVELLDGAADVLAAVSEQYRTGIITNGAADAQQEKITALSLGETVDTVVVAGAECPAKPATDPFERALNALGAEPAETVHIGDTLGTDVAGANAAGIASVWLSDDPEPADCEPTETVGSLTELQRLLDKIE
jgi:putative hydrolase of the HAD superfamily